MMSSVESNVNVTVVGNAPPQDNVTVVTESPPPVVTAASPALKFRYPPLQPLGVLTFWQGILETILRTVICILAFVTMLTAAVARSNVDDIPGILQGEDYVDKSALRSVFGYTVAIAVFILIFFVIIIVIRLLGFGIVNQLWIVIGIMDIVDSFFWAGNSFISTVVSGVGAANASKAEDNCRENLVNLSGKTTICDEFKHVADGGGAAAFFSIVMCIALVALAIYMIFFLALKWNENHLRTAPAHSPSNTATSSTEPYQRME